MTDSPVPPVRRPEAPAGRAAVPAPASAAAGSLQPSSWLFGSPTTYHYRQSVEQALALSDFPRLTSLVANLDPESGSAREFAGGLLWEHNSGYSSLSLTIAPEGASTVIRADANLDGRRFAYFGAAFAAAGLSALLATKVVPNAQAIATGLVAIVLFTIAARALWNASARRSAVALHRLVEQVAAALRGDLS